jgi:hypothetical protein
VRYFFRRRVPPIGRVLLVESGDRAIAERLVPVMRRNHGEQIVFDVLTCYPGAPAGVSGDAVVFRTPDYPDRRALLSKLRQRRPDVIAIICSGEPILFKWKLAVALLVRAKVFIVNENADYFPLEYTNARLLMQLGLDRAGLAGPPAARNIAGILCFPFSLAFLLAYAAWAHARRAVNLALR